MKRVEGIALGLAAAAIAAFAVSFARGFGRDDVSAGPAQPAVLHEAAPEPDARSHGRIEVLNASARRGVARLATEQLRAAGFDVVFFGNAPASAGDSSVVIDRIGDDAVARAVAQKLGIAAVKTQRDSTLYVDATVIVGVDWRGVR
jgi:hypothetical protein